MPQWIRNIVRAEPWVALLQWTWDKVWQLSPFLLTVVPVTWLTAVSDLAAPHNWATVILAALLISAVAILATWCLIQVLSGPATWLSRAATISVADAERQMIASKVTKLTATLARIDKDKSYLAGAFMELLRQNQDYISIRHLFSQRFQEILHVSEGNEVRKAQPARPLIDRMSRELDGIRLDISTLKGDLSIIEPAPQHARIASKGKIQARHPARPTPLT